MLYWWRDSPAWKRMTSLDVPSSPDLKNSFKRRWVGGHIPAHDVKHIHIFSLYPPSPSPSFSVKFACGCKCGEGVKMWRGGMHVESEEQWRNFEVNKEGEKKRKKAGREERKIKWQTERKKERKEDRKIPFPDWLIAWLGFPCESQSWATKQKSSEYTFCLSFFLFYQWC